jgi:hypothetical protein
MHYTKMFGSKFLSLACILPLAFAFLSQGSSCKEDQAKKHKGDSNRPSANQVKSQATEQNGDAIPGGVWGGVGIHMQVTDKGADVEYDCAHGRILEPLRLNAEGRFQAKGTHVLEGPGPVRQDITPDEQPASFTGNVNGKTMTLKVTSTATSETIGTFTLNEGSQGRIRKCG